MLGKIINNILKKPATSAPKPPAPRPDYKRFNDAVLVVTQDNKHGRLLINACNERLVKLIGYSEAEILSLDLRDLLAPDVRELVEDNIEFQEGGRGIDQVLGKVANFRLLGSRARQVPVKLRVMRGVSDSGHITFRLIMNDTSLVGILKEARKEYSILTGKELLVRDMQQVIAHGTTYGYTSSFAVIAFTDDNSQIKRAEKMIESTKRDTDILGMYNDNTLVYLMPDTPKANAITPLVRFRNSLPEGLQTKLVVRYAEISHTNPPADQLKDLMEGQTGSTL